MVIIVIQHGWNPLSAFLVVNGKSVFNLNWFRQCFVTHSTARTQGCVNDTDVAYVLVATLSHDLPYNISMSYEFACKYCNMPTRLLIIF